MNASSTPVGNTSHPRSPNFRFGNMSISQDAFVAALPPLVISGSSNTSANPSLSSTIDTRKASETQNISLPATHSFLAKTVVSSSSAGAKPGIHRKSDNKLAIILGFAGGVVAMIVLGLCAGCLIHRIRNPPLPLLPTSAARNADSPDIPRHGSNSRPTIAEKSQTRSDRRIEEHNEAIQRRSAPKPSAADEMGLTRTGGVLERYSDPDLEERRRRLGVPLRAIHWAK